MNTAQLDPQTKNPLPPRKDKSPVIVYILILFAAAFVLMLFSSLVSQHRNTEALGVLQNSVGTMQEIQQLQEQIIELQEELDETKDALDKAEQALEDAETAELVQLQAALAEACALSDRQTKDLCNTQWAMDLFWQIDEAYVLGRSDRCRELIQKLEAEVLAPYLPSVSTTNNGRFSPYDRYAEICEALGEPYGSGIKPAAG